MVGEPGPGEARVRHIYVAVNFVNTYFQTGGQSSGPAQRPGIVEAVGPVVTDLKLGDRVGYLTQE